ncbi:MAG: hypothetical protein AAF211_07815 [Myxococcota bacterium]
MSPRFVLPLLLFGCPAETAPPEAPIPDRPPSPLAGRSLEALPDDGLAEVARYRFERDHYDVPLEGTVTVLVVRESLDPQSLLKTNRGGGIEALKLMVLETLPSMNWDYRENLAMYSATDLRPLKLAITAEEWCGNNFLEWRERNGRAELIGRPYTDDTAIRTDTVALGRGHHLYEQLPLLVRAVGDEPLVVRLIAPQTAYLVPHTEELTVTLAKAGTERIDVPAGTFETIRIDVTPDAAVSVFPGPESYWLAEDGGFVVKAVRHEYDTEFGKAHVGTATWTLLDHERSAYWSNAVGPVSDALVDRQRATLSAQRQINFRKATAERRGDMFSIEGLPPEYLSDPAGNAAFEPNADGSGGWTLDAEGRFVPNVE